MDNHLPLSICELKYERVSSTAEAVLREPWGCGTHSKACPCALCSVKWLHCIMLVLATSLCLAFSDADNECDIVLMTSAYSQYLRDSCERHTALIGS